MTQSPVRETPALRSGLAIYRMGNRPDAKIPEKWERKWKMAPGPKWSKNGRRNGKMDPKMGFWPFLHFGGHFLALSALEPFSIFFPIFPGFMRRAGFPFCIYNTGPTKTPQPAPLFLVDVSDTFYSFPARGRFRGAGTRGGGIGFLLKISGGGGYI